MFLEHISASSTWKHMLNGKWRWRTTCLPVARSLWPIWQFISVRWGTLRTTCCTGYSHLMMAQLWLCSALPLYQIKIAISIDFSSSLLMITCNVKFIDRFWHCPRWVVWPFSFHWANGGTVSCLFEIDYWPEWTFVPCGRTFTDGHHAVVASTMNFPGGDIKTTVIVTYIVVWYWQQNGIPTIHVISAL